MFKKLFAYLIIAHCATYIFSMNNASLIGKATILLRYDNLGNAEVCLKKNDQTHIHIYSDQEAKLVFGNKEQQSFLFFYDPEQNIPLYLDHPCTLQEQISNQFILYETNLKKLLISIETLRKKHQESTSLGQILWRSFITGKQLTAKVWKLLDDNSSITKQLNLDPQNEDILSCKDLIDPEFTLDAYNIYQKLERLQTNQAGSL
jgi:hypothetical protein